jgi:nucleotide-binding universal stress UspA family protein
VPESQKPLFVVATDGSAPATHAVEAAREHARKWGARLHVVSVVELHAYGIAASALAPPLTTVIPEVEDAALETVQAAAKQANAAGVEADGEVLRGNDAAEVIANYARRHHAQLIIVGSHGRTGIERVVLGSVAERVVRLAPCGVLVVR